MAPIHDTDVGQERWSKAEWENYELWEKVELRLKRHRRFWTVGGACLFLILSAVPIVMERWPKWMTRSVSRVLAQELNRIKREASVDRAAYRIQFVAEGGLRYKVERLAHCMADQGDFVRTQSLVPYFGQADLSWISPAKGLELGIPGLVSEFCYDHLTGSYSDQNGENIVGFGIIPVTDLSEGKLERLSILLLSGPSAELSFD